MHRIRLIAIFFHIGHHLWHDYFGSCPESAFRHAKVSIYTLFRLSLTPSLTGKVPLSDICLTRLLVSFTISVCFTLTLITGIRLGMNGDGKWDGGMRRQGRGGGAYMHISVSVLSILEYKLGCVISVK